MQLRVVCTLLEYGLLPFGLVVHGEELELTVEVNDHASPGDDLGVRVVDDTSLEGQLQVRLKEIMRHSSPRCLIINFRQPISDSFPARR